MVGVIGGNVCEGQVCEFAYRMGALIAEIDAVLVCGGRGGVMEAACKGAVEKGGITVGILPGEQVEEANPYVTIPIATGMGIGRNILIARTADVLVAIDGKYGTLSEMAFALQLGKPVITLHPWLHVPGTISAATPEEAIELVQTYLTEQ
jgi:uncharacterized protein (TIGR00725 family)